MIWLVFGILVAGALLIWREEERRPD